MRKTKNFLIKSIIETKPAKTVYVQKEHEEQTIQEIQEKGWNMVKRGRHGYGLITLYFTK
jgi:hypothetical protein